MKDIIYLILPLNKEVGALVLPGLLSFFLKGKTSNSE
jgi:hypothetical protein